MNSEVGREEIRNETSTVQKMLDVTGINARNELAELSLVQAATFGQAEVVNCLFEKVHIPRRAAEKVLNAAAEGKSLQQLRQDLEAKKEGLSKLATKQKELKNKMDSTTVADTSKKLRSRLYELDALVATAKNLYQQSSLKLNGTTAAYCQIIMQAFQNGARNLTEGLATAASHGHSQLVQFLIEAGANEVSKGLLAAAKNGDVLTLQIILTAADVTDLNPSFCAAAEYGHLEAAKLLLAYGASDFNLALLTADLHRQEHVVKWLSEEESENSDLTRPGHRMADKGYISMLEKARTHELKQAQLKQRKVAHQLAREKESERKAQEKHEQDTLQAEKFMKERLRQEKEERRAELLRQQQLIRKGYLLRRTAKHINIVRREELGLKQKLRSEKASRDAIAAKIAKGAGTLSSLEAVVQKNRTIQPLKSEGVVWPVKIARIETDEYCAAPKSYYVSKYHRSRRDMILQTNTIVDERVKFVVDRSKQAMEQAQFHMEQAMEKIELHRKWTAENSE